MNGEDQNLIVRFKNPTQCHLWSSESPTIKDLDFEPVQTYVDESHFSRSLLRCKRCGQLYYSEFYEIVDWDDGNDDQYSTYIPIEYDEKIIEMLNKRSPLALLGVFPQLNWNNNNPIKWVRKKG